MSRVMLVAAIACSAAMAPALQAQAVLAPAQARLAARQYDCARSGSLALGAGQAGGG